MSTAETLKTTAYVSMAVAAGCLTLATYRIKALNELKQENHEHLPFASDALANNSFNGQEDYFNDIPPNWGDAWGFPWEQLTAHQLKSHFNIEFGGALVFSLLALITLVLAGRQKKS